MAGFTDTMHCADRVRRGWGEAACQHASISGRRCTKSYCRTHGKQPYMSILPSPRAAHTAGNDVRNPNIFVLSCRTCGVRVLTNHFTLILPRAHALCARIVLLPSVDCRGVADSLCQCADLAFVSAGSGAMLEKS